jgi:predicted O-methyltransferase YrrM
MIWPHPLLEARWTDAKYGGEGIAQPWVQLLLYGLVRALGARAVIEFGAFRGVTTGWLALAVEANGGGIVYAVEPNVKDAVRTTDFCAALPLPATLVHVATDSTLAFIAANPDCVRTAGLLFLDDDKAAIAEKVAALRATGARGLLAVHDVDGGYANDPPLRKAWAALGGLTLPVVKVHEHGHLGLLQL